MSKQSKSSKQLKSRASRFLDLNEQVSLGNEGENEGADTKEGQHTIDINTTDHPAGKPGSSPASEPHSPLPHTTQPPAGDNKETESNSRPPKRSDDETLTEPSPARGRKPRNKVEEFHFSVENTRTFAQGGGPNNIWLDPKTRSRTEAIEEALGAQGDKKSTLRLAVAVAVNFLWENHSEEILKLRDAARAKKNQNLE